MAVQAPPAIERLDRQTLDLEQKAAARISGPLGDLFSDLAKALAATYLKATGNLTTPVPAAARDGLRGTIRKLLDAYAAKILASSPQLRARLHDSIRQGLTLGARTLPKARPVLAPSKALTAAVDRLERAMRADLADAADFAANSRLDRYPDVTAMLAKANAAANRAEATTRWVANRSVTEGITAAAEHQGVPRMWVAERDACLTCLAYAGHIVGPGEQFPAGLTYGGSWEVREPLEGPPAHHNCRCRLTPWLGTEPPYLGVQLPTALKREAERSVLTGASAYASQAARLRAADQLLKTKLSGLPESVKKRARGDVDRGYFTRQVRAGTYPKKPRRSR